MSPWSTDDSTGNLSEEQKEKGSEAAATAFCGISVAPALLDRLGLGSCKETLKPIFKSLANFTVHDMCKRLTQKADMDNDFTVGSCETLIGKAFDPVKNSFFKNAASVQKAADSAVKLIQLVKDPDGEIDRLGNKTKDGAVSATGEILKKVSLGTSPNWNAQWFLGDYARAISLGMFVMVFLFFSAVKNSATAESSQETVQEVLKNLPIALLAMMFTPAILAGLQGVLDALSMALINGDKSDKAHEITGVADEINTFASGAPWKAISDPIAANFAGGVLVAILIYGLMLIGALMTLFGLQAQEFGAYMACLGLGVAWGMYVHPRWRDKSLKVLAFVVSLMMMKPLLLLMLSGAFKFLNYRHGEPKSGIEAVVHIGMVAVVLLIVGLTPWGLLKFVPILPNGNEWRQSAGGAALEGGLQMIPSGGAARGRGDRISEGRPQSAPSTPSRPGPQGPPGTGGTNPQTKPGQAKFGKSGSGNRTPQARAGRPASGAAAKGATAAAGTATAGIGFAVAAAGKVGAVGLRSARQAAEDGVETAGEHRGPV